MRLIDADELVKERVENDSVRIAAECAPTVYDVDVVRRYQRMTREECLHIAEEIITGDRENTYGSPGDSFEMIARFWSDYLKSHISAEDVANMMILLKVARIATGKLKADNYVDIAGYAACACEIGGGGTNP